MNINECYDEYMEKPLIEMRDHAFKITLPNTNYFVFYQWITDVLMGFQK